MCRRHRCDWACSRCRHRTKERGGYSPALLSLKVDLVSADILPFSVLFGYDRGVADWMGMPFREHCTRFCPPFIYSLHGQVRLLRAAAIVSHVYPLHTTIEILTKRHENVTILQQRAGPTL
jgi:hypothetical protein